MNENQIASLKNMSVLYLAQMLEDGLIHSGTLNEDMSVYDFLTSVVEEESHGKSGS